MAKSGDLGTLTIDIAANIAQLQEDVGKTKRLLGKMQRDGKDTAMAMNRIGDSVTGIKRLAVGITGAVAAMRGLSTVGRAVITDFRDFESASNDLRKVTDRDIGEIQKQIKTLGANLGNQTELVKAYYQTISAGVTEPKKAIRTVEIAAKAASAAHVEQSEVIKGLTKIMAGYGDQMTDVSEAADLLFGIEKQGQTSFQELIPVIGGLAKASADLGIKQDELGGSLATITQLAGNTDEAATQYKGVLNALLKPTDSLKVAIKSMGFESTEAAIKQQGFTKTLQDLVKYAGGSNEKLAAMFGNQRALSGVLALSNNGFASLNTNIKGVGDSAGATEKAFANFENTLESDLTTTLNEIKNLSIEIGAILAPALRDALQVMRSFIGAFDIQKSIDLADAANMAAKEIKALSDASKLSQADLDELNRIMQGTGKTAELLAGEEVFGGMFGVGEGAQKGILAFMQEYKSRLEEISNIPPPSPTGGGSNSEEAEQARQARLAAIRDNGLIIMADQMRWERELMEESAAAFEASEKRKEEALQSRLDKMRVGVNIARGIEHVMTLVQELGGKKMKALFYLHKGIAAAEAFINYQAAAARADMELPGAGAFFRGLSYIVPPLIMATAFTGSPGGGGGAVGGGGGGGMGSETVPQPIQDFAQPAQTATTTINFFGTVVGDKDALARDLVPAIEKAIADGEGNG